MSVVPKLARRSLRARIGRSIAIGLAILASVSFVSGSFILADSLKATFDTLFTQLTADVDLEVRSVLTVDDISAVRDPVPSDLEQTVSAVPGVAVAEGGLNRTATLLKKDGDVIDTRGAPAIGTSWTEDEQLNGVTLKEGRAPQAQDEVVIDKLTADNNDYKVGDQIGIVLPGGPATFKIVGLIGLGDTDGFGGATIASFARQYSQEILDAPGQWDTIDIRIEQGANLDTVKAAVQQVLPPRTEVVTGEQVSKEASDSINQIISIFGTGLLVFAFITAFVAAFIINNVFGITIGQRLRELALMRGIGASTKQVRRLIVLEALIISLTATILGILAGFGVAKLIIGVFNASGAGFPSSSLVLRPAAVIVSLIVGVGVTMASVIFPARRAAKVPPVAAMRPEVGFAAISSSRRLIGGIIVTAIGAAMFVIGLFVHPGGSFGLIVFAGGGALLIFVGVASLSTTVARPVAGVLGKPIQKVYGAAGKIARDNAMRSPRRTARTASALMIGVALISAAALFTSSLRDTFGRILQRSVTADFIVSNSSFQPIPAEVAQRISALPDMQAVSPVRPVLAKVDTDQIGISAVDPVAMPQLVDIDMQQGGFEGMTNDDGTVIFKDKAKDLGVGMGDKVHIVFSNGQERDVTVVGIFGDNSLGSPLWISTGLLDQVSDQAAMDQLVLARAKNGVDPDVAKQEIDKAIADFPQAEVKTNAEFQKDQEGQINQLLVVISTLLAFAIIISFFGIAVTLALSVFERTREIGLLRAVGMSRRALRRAVRWEAVIVSVFGVVVGVVVGTLIGLALAYAVPNTVIDGITIPYGTIIEVIVLAVIAAVIFALYPAYKASKMNVLDAIASE